MSATYRDKPHAGQLRNFLRQPRVSQVFNSREWQCFRCNGQRHYRRISRIRFAINRRRRQIGRQIRLRRIDSLLYFLFGNVDVEVKSELECDDRAAIRTNRGHLIQARHLPELAFQRRGDCRSRDIRTGSRIKRHDLNRRVVHLWQR